VRTAEVERRVKEVGNILRTGGELGWVGHILRGNCLLRHVIERKREGRVDVTGRRGRRRKQLQNNLKEKRGYCKLKEVENSLWKRHWTEPVVRQTAE